MIVHSASPARLLKQYKEADERLADWTRRHRTWLDAPLTLVFVQLLREPDYGPSSSRFFPFDPVRASVLAGQDEIRVLQHA